MLNSDRLFQTLLLGILADLGIDEPEKHVGADLDVDTFEHLPFLTHHSLTAQDHNGEGLWTVTLTVNVFLAPSDTPLAWVERLYAAIRAWDSPALPGVVPGVGGVEQIVREIAAFDRVTSGALMLGKSVTQYVGSWQLTVRK